MRNWLGVGLFFGVGVAVAPGCSSAAGPATVLEYCQQLAEAECPPVVKLCSSSTEASCESAVESQCETAASAAEAGNLRQFNPQNVAACLSAVTSAYSALNPVSLSILAWQSLNGSSATLAPSPGSPNDLCAQVFAGTVPQDGNCTTSYDCASGNVCGSNGVCGPEADKGSGDGCADPGDLCTDNTVCTLSGKVSICTGGAEFGSTCDDNTPCSTSGECTAGKCVALSGPNGSCVTNADCNQTLDGFCDTSLKHPTCQVGYSFGPGSSDCKAFGGT